MVQKETLTFDTKGNGEIVEITGQVQDKLARTGLQHGAVVVFVPGATGALTSLEYEPGAVKDMDALFEKVAPQEGHYEHDVTIGDGNGHAHVRAALLGPSLTVPFENGRLILGRWQKIVFIDFDTRPRSRELVLQVIGE
jgi:secondary thiamine-phosphate synthase enzyme